MNEPLRWDRLLLDCRLATLAGDEGWGLIEHAALGWACGRIRYVGPMAELPASPDELAREVEVCRGGLFTPALIDCHTHLVFADNRADEFEQRLEGRSYAEIAAAGGGILRSVRQTRAADEDALFAAALPRARALLADGVGTLEIKSGYGLDLETEARMLRVARRLGAATGQRVRTSFLGAHTLPAEYRQDRNGYLELLCERMLPALAAEGLVDAVDAYLEPIAFHADEVERLFRRAGELGLPVRLHADQLSDGGGAALLARYGGLSADHLEYTGPDGVAALAKAGSVAVLLPGAFYSLRETRRPPVDALRASGVPMAVASDLNPGTSPLLSLRLALNMACVLFGLRPVEAVRGASLHAAAALGLSGRCGRLALGHSADIAHWDIEHPAELTYWIGGSLCRRLWVRGRLCHG